jgi:MYXO-CTERM domain-containing protein
MENCVCSSGFEGPSCGRCAAGYGPEYPTCVQGGSDDGGIDGGTDSGTTENDHESEPGGSDLDTTEHDDGTGPSDKSEDSGSGSGGCSTSTGKAGNSPFAELGLASLALIAIRRHARRRQTVDARVV